MSPPLPEACVGHRWPSSLELWSFLVVVWFGSLLASSSLDCRKFLPKVLGGRPSLFWALPVRA